MTKDEAIKYLIKPVATCTVPSKEYEKQMLAYEMAIESLRKESNVHAHWIVLPPVFEEICMCTNCRKKFKEAYQHKEYCPNCNAIMDGIK